MKQRPRRYFTGADKALMWDRWQAGDSLHAIARATLTPPYDCPHAQFLLSCPDRVRGGPVGEILRNR